MILVSSRFKALGVLLVCGGALALAGGCGSDDDKKLKRAAEAGAAGADEGGGPSSGGRESNPGGAAGEPGAGQAGGPVQSEGGAGAGGAPGMSEAGQAGAGGAGIVNDCSVEGSVTGLDVLTEPIYQGCRGGLMRIDFSADAASDTFKCCGSTTSDPSFGGAVLGVPNQDGGGALWVEVPAAAPAGTFALNLLCPSDPSESAVSIEIHDQLAPVVSGISNDQIAAGDVLTIAGENLGAVSSVVAVSRSGNLAFCNIDLETQTSASVSCSFDGITPSADETDLYTLEVADETCGYALNRPTFLAVQNTQ